MSNHIPTKQNIELNTFQLFKFDIPYIFLMNYTVKDHIVEPRDKQVYKI